MTTSKPLSKKALAKKPLPTFMNVKALTQSNDKTPINSNDVLPSLIALYRTGYVSECVIFIPAWPEEHDVMSAIAAKHFLQENAIPTSIHVDEDVIDKLQMPVYMRNELTDDYPTAVNSFVALYLGIRKFRDLSKPDLAIINATIFVYAIAGGSRTFHASKYSIHSVTDDNAQCCLEPLYRQMLDCYKANIANLSLRVITEMFLAASMTEDNSSYCSPSLMSLVRRLIDDGADKNEALSIKNALTPAAWELAKLFTQDTIFYDDGLVITKIPNTDLLVPIKNISWPKSAKADGVGQSRNNNGASKNSNKKPAAVTSLTHQVANLVSASTSAKVATRKTQNVEDPDTTSDTFQQLPSAISDYFSYTSSQGVPVSLARMQGPSSTPLVEHADLTRKRKKKSSKVTIKELLDENDTDTNENTTQNISDTNNERVLETIPETSVSILDGALRNISENTLVSLLDLAPSRLEFRNNVAQVLRTFRYHNQAKIWVALVEETPGNYYVCLFGRKRHGKMYGISKVVFKYGGQGEKNMGKVIIDEGDLANFTRDLHKIIKSVDSGNSSTSDQDDD